LLRPHTEVSTKQPTISFNCRFALPNIFPGKNLLLIDNTSFLQKPDMSFLIENKNNLLGSKALQLCLFLINLPGKFWTGKKGFSPSKEQNLQITPYLHIPDSLPFRQVKTLKEFLIFSWNCARQVPYLLVRLCFSCRFLRTTGI